MAIKRPPLESILKKRMKYRVVIWSLTAPKERKRTEKENYDSNGERVFASKKQNHKMDKKWQSLSRV